MYISKRNFIFTIALLILLGIVAMFILGNGSNTSKSYFVILTFVCNIAISLMCFVKSANKSGYSLNQFFWLFSLFFFGFAALAQYLAQVYSWNLRPTETEIIWTNVLIFVWYMFYAIGGKIRIISTTKTHQKSDLEVRFCKPALNILLVISVLIVIYFMVTIGMNNMLMRGSNRDELLDSTASLIVNHVFRGLLLYNLVIRIYYIRIFKRGYLGFGLSSICFLLCCFPFGLSRYMMAAYYGGLIVTIFPDTYKHKWFSIAIIVGIFILFPAVNIFRDVQKLRDADSVTKLIYDNISGTYLSGDYDAHQMFISVQRYVKEYGVTYGRQLMGVFLFFIPRSIWPSKPIGSGAEVISALDQAEFTNVSAPLVSEFYINFGVIGVILGAILLGTLSAKVDREYHDSRRKMSCINVIYPFVVFYFFFLLRGDLMSSFAYTITNVVCGITVYSLCVRKQWIRRDNTLNKDIPPKNQLG